MTFIKRRGLDERSAGRFRELSKGIQEEVLMIFDVYGNHHTNQKFMSFLNYVRRHGIEEVKRSQRSQLERIHGIRCNTWELRAKENNWREYGWKGADRWKG